jgi:hypothetical protein
MERKSASLAAALSPPARVAACKVKPSIETHIGLSYASALGASGKSPRSHCGPAGGSRPETAQARERCLGLVLLVNAALELEQPVPAEVSQHPTDGAFEYLTDLARLQVTELVPHQLCAVPSWLRRGIPVHVVQKLLVRAQWRL